MRRRPVISLLAAAAVGCLSLGLLAAPADAAPKQINYYALGDSYTYGVGNGGFSYVDKLEAKRTIAGVNLSLPSGGTVASTLAQLLTVSEEADLLTLTVGGIDVDWVDVMTQCAKSEEACSIVLGQAYTTLNATLPNNLDALFVAIKAAAPDAKVVVLGYPHLFTPDPDDSMTPRYIRVNLATDALNRVIKTYALRAGFQFVDVTQRFEGHGANSNSPWINPYYLGVDYATGPLHPNAKGQQAYYAAVRSTGNLG